MGRAQAWLSMQTCTVNGLEPTTSSAAPRFHVCPILTANSLLMDSLIATWASKSPDQAYETLCQDDVSVTNKSDKDLQINKVRGFSDKVQLHMLKSMQKQGSMRGLPEAWAEA